ncbi:Six-hairpin glycosidase-like protein [Umbelopsis sp. PMI_123]|nr:Six-hairpin glycosidase-like protein [Umbelopsis sp. PMI_123]
MLWLSKAIPALSLLALQALAQNDTTSDSPSSTSTGTTSQPTSTVNQAYTTLMKDSLLFYEAQRSGHLPANNRVPWRHDSALQDGSDNNVNLTGGYYDAGDYLKFTLPMAYSMSILSWGAIEYFQGYQLANQDGYLHDMIKWGTDWLIQAHPQPNVFYVQVGDGNVDNNYWGPDTDIPTPRPSYMINSTAPGTDVAAVGAAAFASASYLFRNKFNDSNYADTLVQHGISLFEFAETATPQQPYTTTIPAIAEFYQTQTFQNQLVWGALWLYRATGNQTYLTKASNYFDQFNLGKADITPMDWSDQSGGVFVLGSMLDTTTQKYKVAAERFLDTLTQGKSPCGFTGGGLLWCGQSSNSNSLVPAQDTALLALLYSPINSDKGQGYINFALGQINYMLGNNPMLTPYVVGVHMNSPANPHHAGASGGTDINNINNSPPTEKYVLYGAVVGGPDQNDNFYDVRNDWQQSEVALDYNAPFQGLVAYQLATNASDPPYTTITQPRPAIKKPFPKWAIAVIVIIIILLLVGFGLLWWKRRRIAEWRQRKKQNW